MNARVFALVRAARVPQHKNRTPHMHMKACSTRGFGGGGNHT